MEQCPEIAARYLGICRCNGLRWLVWEDVGGGSLHDLLEESEELGSLRPLAQALGLPFKDKCGASLQVCLRLWPQRRLWLHLCVLVLWPAVMLAVPLFMAACLT
eukprot:1461733-Rhodomonas_salina.1